MKRLQNLDAYSTTNIAEIVTSRFHTECAISGGHIELVLTYSHARISPRKNIGTNVLINRFCPADLNNDGVVEVEDLQILLDVFGDAEPAADVNNDGVVNVLDLIDLLLEFGHSCLPNPA